MIRKTIIVVLVLGAVWIGAIGYVYPYNLGRGKSWQITDRLSAGLWYHYGRFKAEYFVAVNSHDTRTTYRSWMGFHYLSRCTSLIDGQYWLHRKVRGPFLAPVVLLAAYPTIAFIRGPLRRWRRRRRGLCTACGYDLTGNTTGVCSECGRPA